MTTIPREEVRRLKLALKLVKEENQRLYKENEKLKEELKKYTLLFHSI